MNVWEVQLWSRKSIGLADEGEHVCYAPDEGWANAISAALESSFDYGEDAMFRQRPVKLTPSIVKDLNGRWS